MATLNKTRYGTLMVCATDNQYGGHAPIVGARVTGYARPMSTRAADEPTEGQGPKRRRTGASDRDLRDLEPVFQGTTGTDGCAEFQLPAGDYSVECEAFAAAVWEDVEVEADCTRDVRTVNEVGFQVETLVQKDDCEEQVPCTSASEGTTVILRATHQLSDDRLREKPVRLSWTPNRGRILEPPEQRDAEEIHLDTRGIEGEIVIEATLSERGSAAITRAVAFRSTPSRVQRIGGDINVTMRRAGTEPTDDLPLWVVIRKGSEATAFNNYFRFMNHVLCGEPLPRDLDSRERGRIENEKVGKFQRLRDKRFLPFVDADAYRMLKVATEAFLIVNCGVALSEFPFSQEDMDLVASRVGVDVDLGSLWKRYLETVNGTPSETLPYLALIRDKLKDVRLRNAFFADEDVDLPEECFGILTRKLTEPCLLELIWCYWQEEGMLVQTMNAISRRFQNRSRPGAADPLANLEIDPLRPLNNLLWGYLQDEQHRLSIARRGYEYDHHYGLRLDGKAVPEMHAADSRSKFLEAYHNVLHLCTAFFKQDDDTTIVADGFPLLNGLKETHLILSQGAHNQFGDLPSTARIEMLMQQWLLARPELREFLPTRIMVAYPEPWMDRVDAMKKLQGWSDTSVLNFRNLAGFGEQLLLSIRYGSWNDVNNPAQAANWARYWRPEIQGYIHGYRAVTGVDLTRDTVDTTLPSVHLKRRLALQRQSAR